MNESPVVPEGGATFWPLAPSTSASATLAGAPLPEHRSQSLHALSLHPLLVSCRLTSSVACELPAALWPGQADLIRCFTHHFSCERWALTVYMEEAEAAASCTSVP